MTTFSIPDALYEQAVGHIALDYLKQYRSDLFADEIRSSTMLILNDILNILNDASCDDWECIDQIVRVLHSNGIITNRHQEFG